MSPVREETGQRFWPATTRASQVANPGRSGQMALFFPSARHHRVAAPGLWQGAVCTGLSTAPLISDLDMPMGSQPTSSEQRSASWKNPYPG